MSDELDKIKHSKRLLKDETHIKKQLKIAKAHGFTPKNNQEHRFHKFSALNCGNPNCVMCANPRKVFGDKTIQERRFEQKEVVWDMSEKDNVAEE